MITRINELVSAEAGGNRSPHTLFDYGKLSDSLWSLGKHASNLWTMRLGKNTQHVLWFGKKKNLFGVPNPWPLPEYPVLDQKWQIQENWFQNQIQRARFTRKRHPARYDLAKRKIFCSGSRTRDPWISSFGSEIINTGKLVPKSDSATPIYSGRTPNTTWYPQKQNLVPMGSRDKAKWPKGDIRFWVEEDDISTTGKLVYSWSQPFVDSTTDDPPDLLRSNGCQPCSTRVSATFGLTSQNLLWQ